MLQFSQAAGLPYASVFKVSKNLSKHPRDATVKKMAEYFGVSLDDFRDKNLSGVEPSNVTDAPTLKRFRSVRVVGRAQGGVDGYLEVEEHSGTIDHPTKYETAYALRVRGESMRPRIKDGEYIVVEPDIEPRSGDDVVVVCKDGRKMVKELRYRGQGEIELGSINADFPNITLKEEDVEAVQLVAAIVPRGAFVKE